jgi:hypothetical protein
MPPPFFDKDTKNRQKVAWLVVKRFCRAAKSVPQMKPPTGFEVRSTIYEVRMRSYRFKVGRLQVGVPADCGISDLGVFCPKRFAGKLKKTATRIGRMKGIKDGFNPF